MSQQPFSYVWQNGQLVPVFNVQTPNMSNTQGFIENSAQQTVKTPPAIPPNTSEVIVDPPLQGRMVSNIQEILPTEVPMNQRVSWFPQKDYQCIWAKIWTKDNELKTFKFVPEGSQTQQPPQPKEPEPIATLDLSEISKRLDNIEKMIKKQRYKKPYNANNKNEEGV